MGWQCRYGVDETDVVTSLLAQTKDATSAHMNAGFLDVLDGGKSLVVCTCGDDTRVVLPAGVNVVVVCSQSSVFELLCLRSIYV